MKTPRSAEFDSSDPQLPPDCTAARETLQFRLDGDNLSEPEAVREHLAQCAECKALADAGQMFLSALPILLAEPVPAGFADRVMAGLLAAPHRPWYKRPLPWVGAFTLAASVLIAVIAVTQNQTPLTVRESVVVVPAPRLLDPPKDKVVIDKPVPLRDSLQEASSAVAALTRNATADNFGLRLPKWSFANAKMDSVPKIDPPPASIQDVRHNAALGIAPITDSAKRAIDVFWRELGPNMDAKPVNN